MAERSRGGETRRAAPPGRAPPRPPGGAIAPRSPGLRAGGMGGGGRGGGGRSLGGAWAAPAAGGGVRTALGSGRNRLNSLLSFKKKKQKKKNEKKPQAETPTSH